MRRDRAHQPVRSDAPGRRAVWWLAALAVVGAAAALAPGAPAEYRLAGGGVSVWLRESGVRVRAAGASLSFGGIALGRGDRVRPVAVSSLERRDDRVTLRRDGGLAEWYVAG